MKKILPVILALFGLAAGTGAGIFLKPATDSPEMHSTSQVSSTQDAHEDPDALKDQPTADPVRRSENEVENDTPAVFDYVKLNNQFIVPVVNGPKVVALVVISISIEVTLGEKEVVFAREPKLRDTFLQVLFNHANSGGFDGTFTSGEKMNDLRGSLFQAAVKVLGPIATDVLVIDIVRQDV